MRMAHSIKLSLFNFLWFLAGCASGWLVGFAAAQALWPMGVFGLLGLLAVGIAFWKTSRRQVDWRGAFIAYFVGQVVGIGLFALAMTFFRSILDSLY
jgi:hypothetical protein